MKRLLILSVGGCLLAGCVSNENGRVSRTADGTRAYGLNDQPQTSIAGEGSLMPGAYENRQMETRQFTGRERTNDEIGQRPALPPEADRRELARGSENETGKGAGALGQSGVVPGEPVSRDTLIEDVPSGTQHTRQ
jgi:hypothetical protein